MKHLDRARSAIGHGITYMMGAGGLHPADPLPARAGQCDCSGFICWVVGISRAPSQNYPRWMNTRTMYQDAMGEQRFWARISQAVDGCFVIYPPPAGRAGHVALVVSAERRTIIDCSKSQNGIAEHDGSYFWRNRSSIFMKYVGP